MYSGGEAPSPFDHQEAYLTIVLAFFGLTEVRFVRAEGVAMGPEHKAAALRQGEAQIGTLVTAAAAAAAATKPQAASTAT